MNNSRNRVGFVSTRLAGTDGVSLETIKWANLLKKLQYDCFFFAGESDWPEAQTYLVSEAHFNHPAIHQLNDDLFDDFVRSPETSQRVQDLKDHLKQHLYQFIRKFNLDLLIVENALSLPMNVPLGLALTEVIAETDIPTIGHHHDFGWERDRFTVSAADDYLRASFPPRLRSIRHVVINTFAAQQLALRAGVGSTLIPNVMDFESPPPEPDEYVTDLRHTLGIAEDEFFILQPTRIVPRKRIEQAINLLRWLDLPAVLVISHSSGDEGDGYAAFLKDYAEAMEVRLQMASHLFDHRRGTTPDGEKIYSLADAYQAADFITYLSSIEGFGNAFLETVYFRRPMVVSSYNIFRTDIQPKGFKVIGFEDYVSQKTVKAVNDLLKNRSLIAETVAHNYEVARRNYSYRVLEERLVALLSDCLGSKQTR
jgi:glycosyltransferase involved in cell wall biosynthesis